MLARLRHLGRDQSGTTTIEFTIVALLFLLLTFGLVEFGHMFWQYNSAAKAAQLGARLAAVSNPVWEELVNLEDTGTPGAAWETEYTVATPQLFTPSAPDPSPATNGCSPRPTKARVAPPITQ